jgi:hypothetical protein
MADCKWCGAAPAKPYEIEPAVYGSNGRFKRAAIMAPACETHRKRFDAQAAAREREKAKRAAERKQR